MNKKPINWMEYSGVGIQMVLTVLLCWWIGNKVDNLLDFDPWGSLIGILFGIIAGIYNLLKIV